MMAFLCIRALNCKGINSSVAILVIGILLITLYPSILNDFSMLTDELCTRFFSIINTYPVIIDIFNGDEVLEYCP